MCLCCNNNKTTNRHLIDGRADWQNYERLGDPDIEAMAEQILVRTDVLLKGPAARLQVVDWPGASIDVQEPSGEPSTPLGRAKLTQKYLSLATPVYGALRAHSLAETLLSLRTAPLAVDVIRSLRAPN